MSNRKDLVFPLVQYQGDPVGFAKDILGIELWSKQVEILNAFKTHKRVSVKSGHKCGKSTTAVVLALWFYCCFEDARVVFTSSTARQVKDILWRELQKIVRRSKVPIPGDMKELPSSGFTSDDFREIKGFTARDAEAIAGISGKNLLFILDEASGIDDRIYEALEGNRAAGAYMLMISNPTRTQGEFYASHNKKKEFYKTFTISSEDVPNVLLGREVIPGLASREWIEEKKKEWGIESPIYQVRVAGNFPSGDANTVVPVHIIDDAVKRHLEEDYDADIYKGSLEVGIDTARYGDDESVIVIVRNHKFLELKALSHSRNSNETATDEVVNNLFALIQKHKTSRDDVPIVKVDGTGGYGGGVVDALMRRHRECRVIEYNAAQRPANSNDYTNLRDELWFGVAQWLREGGTLPDDDKLHGDLACPLYGFDPKGRRKVEKKDEIKKRLGRSPDRADALALAVYDSSRLRSSQYDDEEADFEGWDFNEEISPYVESISPY